MKPRYALAAVAALTALATAVAFAGMADPKTRLVSRTSGGEPATGGSSYEAVVAANGRFVAFESNATNLPGDGSQIYVRDLDAGKTTLASRTSAGDPAEGGPSFDPAISANGRFVAFESNATNLPGALDVSNSQIYVRDLEQGRTRLVTRTSGGDAIVGNSDDPSISGSGRFVLFESETSDLPGGLGNEDQVYVRDLERGKTTLASRTSGGDPATGGPSDDGSISRDGGTVAYESRATNLPGALAGTNEQIYVRDRDAGKTKLVSRNSAGEAADANNQDPVLSRNGRFVGFESSATNLPGAGAYTQIYLRDRKRGKTSLVSKTTGGEPAAGGHSGNPSISGDGRFVAFYTDATNLPGAGNLVTHVYVHDREAGQTRLASRANDGSPADADSFVARNGTALTGNARLVGFNSSATNLPGSIEPFSQVYVRGPLR